MLKKHRRKLRLLCICTGNKYRSPFAEAVAKKAGFDARSAGVGKSIKGGSIPGKILRIAWEMNYNIPPGQRSRLVTKELFDWADVVLCMQESHLISLRNQYGFLMCRKVRLLSTYCDPPQHKIPDPAFGDEAYIRYVCLLIQQAIYLFKTKYARGY